MPLSAPARAILQALDGFVEGLSNLVYESSSWRRYPFRGAMGGGMRFSRTTAAWVVGRAWKPANSRRWGASNGSSSRSPRSSGGHIVPPLALAWRGGRRRRSFGTTRGSVIQGSTE